MNQTVIVDSTTRHNESVTPKSNDDDVSGVKLNLEIVKGTILDLTTVPIAYRGELHLLSVGWFRSWSTCYIVLEEGVLQCYDSLHHKLFDVHALHGFNIEEDPADAIEVIRIKSIRNPDVCLKAQNPARKSKWSKHVAAHIDYANLQHRHNRAKYLQAITPYIKRSFRYSIHDDPLQVAERKFDQAFSIRWNIFGYSQSEPNLAQKEKDQTQCSNIIDSQKIASCTVPAPISSNTSQSSLNSDLDTSASEQLNGPEVPSPPLHRELILQYNQQLRRIEPPVCIGWIHKLGRIVRSIRFRLFILERGVLTYYSGLKTDIGRIEYIDQEWAVPPNAVVKNLMGVTAAKSCVTTDACSVADSKLTDVGAIPATTTTTATIGNRNVETNEQVNTPVTKSTPPTSPTAPLEYPEQFLTLRDIELHKKQIDEKFTLKGSMRITNYELFSKYDKGHIKLVLVPSASVAADQQRKLVLAFSDYGERARWIRALNYHIDYIPN